MTDLNKTLNDLYWSELEKEGITKECVEFVDLDFGFSPVSPHEGSPSCEVFETVGGNYIVMSEPKPLTVTPQVLKVMRYRYLQFDPTRLRAHQDFLSSDFAQNLFKKVNEINITYQALDRDGWPVVTESSKPCHTISNGIECYRCATCCAGLNNCELKKTKP